MSDDPYAERKRLTFEQAEGVDPLPSQLAPKEVSQELRARLWHIIHSSMEASSRYSAMGGTPWLDDPWKGILIRKHVYRDHKMADDFKNVARDRMADVRHIIENGDYVQVFGFVQWLLSTGTPIPAKLFRGALERSRAAYRLLDDDRTIVPITSQEEADAINRAFADLSAKEFDGARRHLREAARLLTSGTPAASIRESIHAVESVARAIGGTSSLSGALQKLKSKGSLHPALERGFNNLYGFTSDEEGIRHPLIEEGSADVDEVDAIFMIGACASFVSYLINNRPTH